MEIIEQDDKVAQLPAEEVVVADPSTTTEVVTEQPAKYEQVVTGDAPAVTEQTAATEAGDTPAAKPTAERRALGAERRIAQLSHQNKELKEKLRASLVQPAHAEAIKAAAKPEETEEYWTRKYQSALSEDERNHASREWQRIHDNNLVNQIESRVAQRQSAEKQADLLSTKLTKLHERQPFLKEDGSVDMSSPLVIRAGQLAAEAGSQLNRWETFLYFATEAALESAGSSADLTKVQLGAQRLATVKAAAGTSLERPSASVPTASLSRVAAIEKDLAELEAKRSKGYNSELNRQVLIKREELRQARLSKK